MVSRPCARCRGSSGIDSAGVPGSCSLSSPRARSASSPSFVRGCWPSSGHVKSRDAAKRSWARTSSPRRGWPCGRRSGSIRTFPGYGCAWRRWSDGSATGSLRSSSTRRRPRCIRRIRMDGSGSQNLMVRSGLVSAPEAALDSAIEANPRRADARRMRASVRFELGRYHGALRDAELALAAESTDVASWGLLIRSTARSRGPAAGLDAATRAMGSVGRKPALVRAQAWLLAEAGRTQEALTLLDQEMQAGDSAIWRRTLARVQARAGDLRAARTQVELVLSGSPLDEEMLGLRSVLDAAGGHVETALRRSRAGEPADAEGAAPGRPPE